MSVSLLGIIHCNTGILFTQSKVQVQVPYWDYKKILSRKILDPPILPLKIM